MARWRPRQSSDEGEGVPLDQLLQDLRGILVDEAFRNFLEVFAVLLVFALAPQLLLPVRPYGTLLVLCMACLLVATAFLLCLSMMESEAPEALAARQQEEDWAVLVETWLDKAMAMSDAEWRKEGEEATTSISSKDMGTRFPAFRGIVEESGASLRQHDFTPSAEEVMALGLSFAGRQASDPFQAFAADSLVQRLGPSTWLSFHAFSGNRVQSQMANLVLQAVRRSTSPGGPRFTCVAVPAPAPLASQYESTVERLKQGEFFKEVPLCFAAMDVRTLADGGLRVCNIIQVDPSVPRFMPSSLVNGIIKTLVCNGATYLKMAQTQLPEPLTVEGPSSAEALEQVRTGGQTVQLSRLLAEVLGVSTEAQNSVSHA